MQKFASKMSSFAACWKIAILFTLSIILVASYCTTNRPPSNPVIFGRNRASVLDTIVIHLYSVDPEDNVITYLIEWGDTTSARWSPFFPSGETVSRSHVYTDTGIYYIRAKARDIDRGESDWSDFFRLQILPETVYIFVDRR